MPNFQFFQIMSRPYPKPREIARTPHHSEDEEDGNTPLTERLVFWDTAFLCCAVQPFPSLKEFYCFPEGSSSPPTGSRLASSPFPHGSADCDQLHSYQLLNASPSPKQKHPFRSPPAHPPLDPAASLHSSKKSSCSLDNSKESLSLAERRRRCSCLLPNGLFKSS